MGQGLPGNVTVADSNAMKHCLYEHESAGSAFIQEADVPTSAISILTIAPRSGLQRGLANCTVHIDLAVADAGWRAIVTGAETLIFYIRRKIDGTNYRISEVSATFTGNAGVNTAVKLDLGMVSPDCPVDIQAIQSVDRGAIEFGYRVVWQGDPHPTITARAAS